MDNLKKKLNQVVDIFTGELTQKNVFGLILYFACISLLELFAYTKKGIFSIVASRVWLFTAIALMILCVYYAGKVIIDDFRKKAWLSIIGFGILFVVFCSYIGNMSYSDVNADAAQQIAAGLSSFEVSDHNYTGVAFLGYANRQYVLAAIPALLLGRSIFTLHLGFAFPFLFGLVILYLELRMWLKENELREEFALVPLYAFPAFRFITEYYMNFEQAITPVALTMIGIALFLRLVRKNDLLTFIALAWVGCFACDSYTPILASLGLLLCFYVLYAMKIIVNNLKEFNEKIPTKNTLNVIAIGASVLNIFFFFAATILAERSDRVDEVREDISIKDFAFEAWTEFFTDKNAVFLGIFAGIILLYIALSFLGRLKFQDFTISCWVFGVVFFANYMVGYTSYEKAWILQRNMIVIPVLITAIFMAIMRGIKSYDIKMNPTIIISLMLFFGVIGIRNFAQPHQSFNYFRYIQPMKYMLEYAEETIEEQGYKDTDEFNLVLFTNNALQTNVYDYAKFLFPNANAVSFSIDSYPEGLDYSLPTFYFSESPLLQMLGNEKMESKKYVNERYETEGEWYSLFIE